MKITYFIRNNNNEYSEPCGVASIKITKDNKVYYAGGSWGENSPTDTIEFIITTPEELGFYNWLDNLGYHVVPTEV